MLHSPRFRASGEVGEGAVGGGRVTFFNGSIGKCSVKGTRVQGISEMEGEIRVEK